MIRVTDAAMEELMRTLERTSLAQGKHLRLATPPEWTGEGDFGIVIAEELDGDRLVEHEGDVVLLVDWDLMERMPKAVLDFKEAAEGSRFTLDVF